MTGAGANNSRGCKGGVLVLSGGEARVLRSQLEENALAHISVREYGHCTVSDCYIARGGASGIHGCTIAHNRAFAIEVQGGDVEEAGNWLEGNRRGSVVIESQ
ncbi:hypothetical protein T492DRAFT_1147964 [Pavlovales sp. CCMP2436]|nr:hypothetical protein T492DRAFT_1147964 [Pavlovales sp. CCMP2436]